MSSPAKVVENTAAGVLKTELKAPSASEPPARLRGLLSQVSAKAPANSTTAGSIHVQRIIAASNIDWRGIRTSPSLIHDLCPEVLSAKTVSELQAAGSTSKRRLMGTGVFKSVDFSAERVGETAGVENVDFKLYLDEAMVTMNTGASTAINGSLSASSEFSLLNVFGQGESLSASIGSSTGEISVSDVQGIFGPALPPAVGGPAAVDHDLVHRLPRMASPTVSVAYRQPTLFGSMTPLTVRARAEVERHEAVSGYSSRIQDADVTITDPTGKHALTYSIALRSVVPLPHVGKGRFMSASSAEVVADSDSSIKSSILYSYVRNKLNHVVSPTRGYRSTLNAELAGLGGDVCFGKLSLNHTAAASFFRFAPDTGFALPLSRSAFLAASPYDFAEVGSGTEGLGGLKPHPGPDAYASPWTWLRNAWRGSRPPLQAAQTTHKQDDVVLAAQTFLRGTRFPIQRALDIDANETTLAPLGGPRVWSTGRQLAGWLAPGVTLRLDGMLGAMVPYGHDATARTTGTRILDRFFLAGPSVRGFESVGPKAAPVPGGTINGDVLGGNAVASLSARILLPPPLPSITLANAGLRTHLFATVGALLPRADGSLFAPDSALKNIAASAGVGVVLPVMDSLAIELNYALWHKAGVMDVASTFKMQLTI